MKNYTRKKTSGVHFTPIQLANYVAINLINQIEIKSKKKINVLDPSCGDGELLLSFINNLPIEYHKNISIYGIEFDLDSIEKTKERLNGFKLNGIYLNTADFLELIPEWKLKNQQCLFDLDTNCNSHIFDKIDVVIANPPYVRTQIMGAKKAQELSRKFNLTGRVDLYHAFLVAMTSILSDDGLLGVITSNRFISNRAGENIRNYLQANYEIIKLIDLGDTKLFEAAVLPSIFFGRKKQANQNKIKKEQSPHFYRIYEKNSNDDTIKCEKENTIYDIIHNEKTGCFQVGQILYEANVGHFHISTISNEPWKLVTKNENDFIETIIQNSINTIDDIAKVRVGIKTNADTVFIRNDWDELVSEIRPESELLKPILSSYEANKWISKSNDRKKRYVLYTHLNKNGKRTTIELSNFPKAKKYLEQYREKLEERKYLIQANRQWYEIWVPQNPNSWKEPKIIFPDISPEPKFFFDNNNSIVDGNCYWITIDDNCDKNLLFLILGLANSEILTRFHDLCFNNKLYSGRRRYFTQYVAKYPLPDINKNECKEIIKLVKYLINNNADKNKSENCINALAYKAYGF